LKSPKPGQSLTRREREVMDLIVGRTCLRKHLADKMGISENTVKLHLRNAYKKLRAVDKVTAALTYRQLREAVQKTYPNG
jgi:DNA-binding CsgD family transcriptional regulator